MIVFWAVLAGLILGSASMLLVISYAIGKRIVEEGER